jgi:ParB family transcriptional regulator, chromosome partitioning protein
MSAKKTRLGRGLDALIGAQDVSTTDTQTSGGKAVTVLPVASLRRGRYQPRTRMDEESLQELAASIRSQGVIQPILVREIASGGYEIIAGERRWRAAQIAGLDEVPVVVRQVPDEAAMAVALIENIQREDLSPIEEATGVKRLLDEFGLTHQDAADRVGRSRAAVSNLLRLLNLETAVRTHLEDGNIEMGHARALLGLPREQQTSACEMVMHRRLSVRQTEQLVRRMLTPNVAPADGKRNPEKNGDIRRLEAELSEKLGASVSIDHGAKRGRLIIEYHNLDELDGILSRIR